MQYRRKPEIVDAFRFGEDVEMTAPDWFIKAVDKEQITIDRAITDGAVRVYGCTIQTAAGRARGKNGDFVVRGSGGRIFLVKAKEFKKQYERIEHEN